MLKLLEHMSQVSRFQLFAILFQLTLFSFAIWLTIYIHLLLLQLLLLFLLLLIIIVIFNLKSVLVEETYD